MHLRLWVLAGCVFLVGCHVPGSPPSPPPSWVSADGIAIQVTDSRRLVGPDRKEKLAPYSVCCQAVSDAIKELGEAKPTRVELRIESYRMRLRGFEDHDGLERPTDAAWPVLLTQYIEEDGFPVVTLGILTVSAIAVGVKEMVLSRKEQKDPDFGKKREWDRLAFGVNVWIRARIRLQWPDGTTERVVAVRGFGDVPHDTSYWGDSIRAAEKDAATLIAEEVRAAVRNRAAP